VLHPETALARCTLPWTNLMLWGLKPPRSLDCGPGSNIRPGTGSKLASPARLEEPAVPSQEKLKMPVPGASRALGPEKTDASVHGTTASEDPSRPQPEILVASYDDHLLPSFA